MSRPGRGFRVACHVFGVLFSASAAVQLNDPDPVRWIVLYLAAAGVSFASGVTGLSPVLPTVLGVVAFGWAVLLFPSALDTSFREMFAGVRMMSPAVEEGRETLGLAIVALWMAVLARRSSRPRA